MKLPSITTLISGAGAALRRFPLAIASGVIAGAGAVWLIERADQNLTELTSPSNLFLVGMLGIAVFVGIRVLAEHRQWPAGLRRAVTTAGAAALAGYFFLLPRNVFDGPLHHVVTYGLLIVAAHFAVAVASYTGPGQVRQFWDFNKSLFLRFLAAVLYSGVLFVGLSVAMVALDELLGVTIDGRRYGQLFAVIGLAFNTWFFVSSIPPVPAPGEQPYPRALKTFSQYILIPLVAVYVLILYAYAVKIIATWTWPEGWVANLVLGFSVTGILALLFVHPIRNDEENRWIRRIWRWYFPALFPLTVLLLLAIWRRVSEYGVTPNRYFVIVLGLWLAGLVVYFTVRRSGNIAVIPLSFLALVLLSAFGPWGALPASERSQRGRLEELLVRHEILRDGSIVRAAGRVAHDDAAEISSLVRYFVSMHGPESLRPWFGARLDSIVADSSADKDVARADAVASRLVGAMGVPFAAHRRESSSSYYFRTAERQIPISGYHYLYAPGTLRRSRPVADDSSSQFRAYLDPDRGGLTMKRLAGGSAVDSASVSLRSWLDTALKERPDAPPWMPAELMVVDGAGAAMEIRVLLSDFEGRRVGDSVIVESVTPEILVRDRAGQPSRTP